MDDCIMEFDLKGLIYFLYFFCIFCFVLIGYKAGNIGLLERGRDLKPGDILWKIN